MNAPWATGVVQDAPNYIAPSGETEIRLLPSLPRGELTHATLPAGAVSKAARVNATEAFYVLQGLGELWRADDRGQEVVELRPRRCVTMPPGVGFQYRALGSEPLVFIVAVMPRWSAESWHELADGTGAATVNRDAGCSVRHRIQRGRRRTSARTLITRGPTARRSASSPIATQAVWLTARFART